MNLTQNVRMIVRCVCSSALFLCLASIGVTADENAEAPAPKRSFLAFLIPKAFQANPSLEMTVHTEMTAYGNGLPQVSPQEPMYYVAHSAGFRPMGASTAGEHPPMPEELEGYMFQGLEARGFQAAVEGEHPPQLALIYYWGSHNSIDADTAKRFPDLLRTNLLERASLVGGRKFAHEVAMQLDFGAGPQQMQARHQNLMAQVSQDVYYVVVSAYSYEDLVHDKHILAWRTTMTVTSNGLAMRTAMPPLVVTAGDYFGRPTPGPVAVRRSVRDGTVSFGELEVIETVAPETPAPSRQPAEPAR